MIVHPDRPYRSTLCWPGMRSHYCRLPPDSQPTVTYAQQIGVSFSGHENLVFSRSGGAVRTNLAPGSVVITGGEAVSWLRVAEPTEALEIYLDPRLLTDDGAEPARFVPVDPSECHQDPIVLGIAGLLRRVHLGRHALTDVAASTLAHRLITRVDGDRATTPAPSIPGVLDRRTLQRVTEVIEGGLHETLTLARLAATAHLSPFHFARTFKVTTGLTPHQYVTMRRVERAKHLLMTTDRSLFRIAHSVGMTNVGHFRRVFAAHTGLTPSALRAAR